MNNNAKDEELLQQIEREVRMQEGAGKLLAASTRREQALEASKSLLTCNARILALLSQLQRMKKAQVLQRVGHRPPEAKPLSLGKVSVSDLRIPLMWKDSEYFKNKGELHRCAVFCMLQCGTEVRATDLVTVDRTLTDICFEEPLLFNKAGPGFQLRLEIYSTRLLEDLALGPAGPRRARRLQGSLGCSSGKKIRAAFESATMFRSKSSGEVGEPGTAAAVATVGPKFSLLAHTTLRLEDVQEGFKTHDLSLAAAGESLSSSFHLLLVPFIFSFSCISIPPEEDDPFWLPLYGSVCCRLVAQPLCMIQPIISGQFKVQLGKDLNCWQNVHGVLRGQNLFCFHSQAEQESEDEPLLIIPIKKDTRVSVSGSECRSVRISMRRQDEDCTFTLGANTSGDARRWSEALWEHILHMSQWKQCSDRLMKIEMLNAAKRDTLKRGSLFHEIVTPNRLSEDLHFSDLSVEVRALLSSYYKESY
ncbi:rhotekin-like isoform X2 [Nelusetta ayraudi]|uniref:rhotekin-like isoform X2 n=1 Tax=Nelusetta ayraudi TaxID=303726 RepID=UPI003F6E703D